MRTVSPACARASEASIVLVMRMSGSPPAVVVARAVVPLPA
jgi:hypothetical protein